MQVNWVCHISVQLAQKQEIFILCSITSSFEHAQKDKWGLVLKTFLI